MPRAHPVPRSSSSSFVGLVGLVVLSLLCRPAWGEDAAVEVLAVRAAEVVELHCVELHTEGVDMRVVAERLQAVIQVWTDLDRELQRRPEPHLLYWRGRLAECLEREEAAAEDLRPFVDWFEAREAVGATTLLQQMHREATRRLRRLERGTGEPARRAPGPAPGKAKPPRAREAPSDDQVVDPWTSLGIEQESNVVVDPWRSSRSATARRIGGVFLAAGGAVSAGGFVLHGATWGLGQQEEDRATYEGYRGANQAGLVLGVVGASAAAAGVVALIAGARPRSGRVALSVGPVTSLTLRF